MTENEREFEDLRSEICKIISLRHGDYKCKQVSQFILSRESALKERIKKLEGALRIASHWLPKKVIREVEEALKP